jgi:hypothetical protein
MVRNYQGKRGKKERKVAETRAVEQGPTLTMFSLALDYRCAVCSALEAPAARPLRPSCFSGLPHTGSV